MTPKKSRTLTQKILRKASRSALAAVVFGLALGAGSWALGGVCITDQLGNCIDRLAPFPATGAANLAVTQVTMGVSALQLVPARTGNIGAGRVSLWIVNGGNATVYCGPTSGVTTANGAAIPSGGVSPLINTTSAVYCISGSSSQVVSAWETY